MKAYFYINGLLLNTNCNIEGCEALNLDNQYIYEVNNFGVAKDFDKCKYGAICDVFTDPKGNRKIMENSYVAIFEIEISKEEYKTIDSQIMIADFDILDKIKDNLNNLIYSCMFDNNSDLKENFILKK